MWPCALERISRAGLSSGSLERISRIGSLERISEADLSNQCTLRAPRHGCLPCPGLEDVTQHRLGNDGGNRRAEGLQHACGQHLLHRDRSGAPVRCGTVDEKSEEEQPPAPRDVRDGAQHDLKQREGAREDGKREQHVGGRGVQRRLQRRQRRDVDLHCDWRIRGKHEDDEERAAAQARGAQPRGGRPVARRVPWLHHRGGLALLRLLWLRLPGHRSHGGAVLFRRWSHRRGSRGRVVRGSSVWLRGNVACVLNCARYSYH